MQYTDIHKFALIVIIFIILMLSYNLNYHTALMYTILVKILRDMDFAVFADDTQAAKIPRNSFLLT